MRILKAAVIIFVVVFLTDCKGQAGEKSDLQNEEIKTDTIETISGKQMNKVEKTDEEWRKELTATQYHVLREKGTERAFTGEYDHHKEKGIYTCAGCGAELFASDSKYDSGCGWPAFFTPLAGENVIEKKDISFGMVRTEILCAACGGHLGHVFDDGPDPTGLRYCVNSASLKFKKSVKE